MILEETKIAHIGEIEPLSPELGKFHQVEEEEEKEDD